MKYEYMIQTRRYRMDVEGLNDLGSFGWELAAVVLERDNAYTTYYFKRAQIAR